MSGVQKLFKTVLPNSWAESMEKESREWLIRCAECGFEKSVWDAGGIRWKAAGNPKNKALCAKCGKLNWHSIYRKTEKV